MHVILFIVFAIVALGGGVNLLIQRAPIYSALSLVAVMAALAGLYLLLGAEFIAFIQLLVYAGAIMVLFVFVIMLLNAQAPEPSHRSKVARAIGIPVFVLLVVELGASIYGQFATAPVALGDRMIHVEAIGNALFHDYLLPFEVTSILFLVGVLGAVVLAARREEAPSAATASPTRAERPHISLPPAGRASEVKELTR